MMMSASQASLRGEVVEQVRQLCQYISALLVFNPQTAMAAHSMPLCEGAPAVMTPQYARRVVQSVDWDIEGDGTGEEIKQVLVIAVQHQLSTLTRIHAQRAELSAALQQATAAGNGARIEELVGKLESNVMELRCTNAVASGVYSYLAPPLVLAQMWVRSYPHWPVAAPLAQAFLQLHGPQQGALQQQGIRQEGRLEQGASQEEGIRQEGRSEQGEAQQTQQQQTQQQPDPQLE